MSYRFDLIENNIRAFKSSICALITLSKNKFYNTIAASQLGYVTFFSDFLESNLNLISLHEWQNAQALFQTLSDFEMTAINFSFHFCDAHMSAVYIYCISTIRKKESQKASKGQQLI